MMMQRRLIHALFLPFDPLCFDEYLFISGEFQMQLRKMLLTQGCGFNYMSA